MTTIKKPIVGHTLSGNSTAYFKQAISEVHYPISNNIGVGILSYNRLPSLQRLIESIRNHTDLKRTTVFVSDESTNQDVKTWLNLQQDIIVVDNPSRLGVAGNSNRLLRCLSRFKHKIMLNDDVLVLKTGWEKFYADAMATTGMHHFCYRQNGVYGARAEDITTSNSNGLTLKTIKDKPQGSIMAFDQKAFDTVGYFDERFGLYGMEHVDWSRRLSQSNIQLAGFHDVAGSENYFAISKDESAVEQRGQHLSDARNLYTQIAQEQNRTYVASTDISRVPSISYVIPYRSMSGRNDSIATVVANIRAQRFPYIEIIVSEEDAKPIVNIDVIAPVKHVFTQSSSQFCKSAAFNLGVKNVKTDYVVLHDADILVPAG
jgi:glycosyltransferase involved in cell wall biosynthesis